MEKIEFAIVGCGNIGKRHLAVIDAEPMAELVAICDIDEKLCQEMSKLYGGVKYFTNYSEMVKETKAKIINICTPHGLHAEMAILAMKSKKNVLVEKPMALNAKDCRDMIACSKANNVKLWVVKQNRYNAPIALTRKTLIDNKLGKIYMVDAHVLWNRYPGYYTESTWRGKKVMEGGVLYTQVSHFIDLLIWWFGDVKSVKSIVETMKQPVDIEDCGSAILQFQSGVLGSLTWTTCVYNKNYEGSITIIGEKGTIKIGGEYLNQIDFWDVQSYPLPKDIKFDDKPNLYGKYQGTSSNHDKVVDNIIKDFLNERHDVVEGDEGIKTIEAIEKIYAATNK